MSKSLRVCLTLSALCLTVAVYAQQLQPQQPQSPIVTVPGTPPEVNPSKPNMPAVSVKELPSPAAPSHAPEQVEWGLIASYAYQYIKKSKLFTFITPETSGRIQALVGFGLAAVTAAGIHFSVTGSLLDGSGAAITITGVSLDAFKDIAWQWAAQQGWYDMVVSKQGANAIPNPAPLAGGHV